MTAVPSTATLQGVLTLVAPLSGVIVPLEQVPDATFAQRLVGDGISIDPLSNRVLAPCDARVLQLHRANHALTLLAASGELEIMIHVGLDTVNLKGEGFTALVKTGDEVRTGDALITFDADLVARRARSLLTQVLVTNMERVASIAPRSGLVTARRDVLMRVALAAGPGQASATREQGEAVESRPIVITAETGLHARPAAALASAARRFVADVRLVKDGRDANVRSVVSIMALEVGGGDTVTVLARGEDASAAVAAIS
jgi:multiphosphoryl transfer protein